MLLVTVRPVDKHPSCLQLLGHVRERSVSTDWEDVSLFPHLKGPVVVSGILEGNALKSAEYSSSSRSHQAPDELIKAQLKELVLDTIAIFVFHRRQGVLDDYKES
jgi:hypothetical protein